MDVSLPGDPTGIVSGDFDKEDGNDLATSVFTNNLVSVFYQQPNGSFGVSVP